MLFTVYGELIVEALVPDELKITSSEEVGAPDGDQLPSTLQLPLPIHVLVTASDGE